VGAAPTERDRLVDAVLVDGDAAGVECLAPEHLDAGGDGPGHVGRIVEDGVDELVVVAPLERTQPEPLLLAETDLLADRRELAHHALDALPLADRGLGVPASDHGGVLVVEGAPVRPVLDVVDVQVGEELGQDEPVPFHLTERCTHEALELLRVRKVVDESHVGSVVPSRRSGSG
jgi:hypothetical protein